MSKRHPDIEQQIDESQVVDEAVKFMYQNISRISFTQLFFPASVAWMFWGTISHSLIILWSTLVVGVYITRIIMSRRFHLAQIENGQYYKWANYFTVTAVVSGILWGGAGVIFYSPNSVNLQVLLYVIIVGVAAGSLVVNCYWLPSFYAYSIPAIGFVSANLILVADTPGKVLGALLLLYLIILINIAKLTRELMYHSIRSKFENLALVEELKKQKERAETANRAKTRFLASANHDLRQPVHALSLMTYAAKDELKSPRGKKLYDSMDRTIRSLSQLLESLLDLSRLDAGAMNIDVENVNLRPLGAQLLTEFLPMAQRKQLRLGLGPFDFIVNTDIALVERVLRNLVGNAVRYTNEGGVLIGCRRRDNFVSIEVWDTGVGINDTDAERVFTEFYQGNNPDHDRSQGLGLGLSICNRISELLGYEFSYHSVPGKGTVFRLKVPLSVQGVIAQNEVSGKYVNHEDALLGIRVLVIDDELIVREAVAQVISSWGGEVLLAASGLDALGCIGELDGKLPDVIICDFRLSLEENGLDAIQLIHSATNNPDIPAMILTGDTAPKQVKEFKKYQFPVLHKPVHPEELFTRIKSVLRKASR